MAKTPTRAAAMAAGAAAVSTADVEYYKVKVSEPFLLYEVLFRPGEEYTVSARVYDSMLPDSRNFKDLCVSVTPKLAARALP